MKRKTKGGMVRKMEKYLSSKKFYEKHIFRIRHSIMEKRKTRKSRKGMSRKKGKK